MQVHEIAERGKCGFNYFLFTLMSVWTRNREVCLFLSCQQPEKAGRLPLPSLKGLHEVQSNRGVRARRHELNVLSAVNWFDPGQITHTGCWVLLGHSVLVPSQRCCCGEVLWMSPLQLLSAAALCFTPCIMWPVVLKWKISFCKVQWLKSYRVASQRSMKLNTSLPLNSQIFLKP